MASPIDQQPLEETEELLEWMKHVEPPTRQEVCDHYGIELEDFPKFALANCERELEKNLEMTRGFRSLKDKESIALVRRIDQRNAVVRRSIDYWVSIIRRGGAP